MIPIAPIRAVSLAPKRTGSVYIPKKDSRISQTMAEQSPLLNRQQRDSSTSFITTRLAGMSLRSETPRPNPKQPGSPSKIPLPSPRPSTPTPVKFVPMKFPNVNTLSPQKNQARSYLTKYSTLESWDPEEQYGNMERMYEDVCKHYKQAMDDNIEAKQVNTTYKDTIVSLEEQRKATTESIIELRCELETTKYRLEAAERSGQEEKRDLEIDIEELKSHHRVEIENHRQSHREDLERLKSDHREELRELRRRFEEDIDKERSQRMEAIAQASTQGVVEKQQYRMDLEIKAQEVRAVKMEVDRLQADLDREKSLNDDLRLNLSNAGSNAANMETARQALQAKVDYLESDCKSQSEAYATMERRMNEAIEKARECEDKLRKEEMLRRRLHNQVQELKGNIRVFCRVRPINGDETEEAAKISVPESDDEPTDIEVKGPEETNSLGKVTTKTHQFSFDRVFDPSSNNAEIFEEISQLIQSALDGYNVCIFAYGQTGSGKTFTMSSDDGMIPQALRQIYTTSKELENRGWKYTMEGSFVEVYNEELRDLLGKEGENDKGNKKHEIRHDMATCETTITDVTTLNLDSQEQVEGILAQAMSRRSVAATKANERSSRSHSVFILKLEGYNSITGQKSKGTLNLVDLAGSERLSHSKVEGARLKETQNINKSLSCLGDVIGALGQQQAAGGFNPRSSVNGAASDSSSSTGSHIPYRNSKLTYLLQFSLGGNSKTLMFVMVAPEKKCLSETITSLKFADKVSRTKIGVAKKTSGSGR
jgi:kinesin family protein C1